MAIKIAFIGAGSVGFTRRLFRDVLTVPELQDTHFAFTDISKHNLEMVTQLCEKDIAQNHLPAPITATTNRRRALQGADYVINCTRIGGQMILSDVFVAKLRHHLEIGSADVGERKMRVLQFGYGENVAEQAPRESDTARADESYFDGHICSP